RFAQGLGYSVSILGWFYDGGSAPSALPRRRISLTEECRIALRAFPMSFGRPGESRRPRARRLGDAMEMTGVDTDVLSGLIYHRPPSGWSHRDGFAEDPASMEVMLPPVESGGSDDEVVKSVERRSTAPPMEFSWLLGELLSPAHGHAPALGHIKVCPLSSSDRRPVLGSTPEVDADGVEMLGVSVVVEDRAVAVRSAMVGLGLVFVESLDVRVYASGVGEGGLVREEGRDPPVAMEAVRPQPTDGLRQLPRSPEESLPVSEVVAAAGGGLARKSSV
ncbi:hypothetical protein Dimus_035845, partial [Dionaea muscipula]